YFLTRYGAYRNLNSFPTRRSSDLDAGAKLPRTGGRPEVAGGNAEGGAHETRTKARRSEVQARPADCAAPAQHRPGQSGARTNSRDRKSTRLNSSHDQISYAVFCLK